MTLSRFVLGYELLFLPAYSLDYNPIEESFSCCKDELSMLYAGMDYWHLFLP